MIEYITSIRACLRSLQKCPAHARVSFYHNIASLVDKLFDCLPDPLFIALANVVRSIETSPELKERKTANVLEGQLVSVVNAVQTEILTSTRNLTKRSGVITLRFRSSIPFV
ncbi:hypothetical protein, conserved [Angomonas deanei]|uniref:Uncharacterized protein n=1 Tax=Angomonas deanei TaxID=59799 RepID=A0A7G2CF58_9TRYP|nr:hypothetical protein, conserved [Angomonas deanei]